jgi:hypothetical protein
MFNTIILFHSLYLRVASSLQSITVKCTCVRKVLRLNARVCAKYYG